MAELLKPSPKELQKNTVDNGLNSLIQMLYDFEPLAPELLLNHAHTYLLPSLRWEIVRKSRGPTLLKSQDSATGFEGYVYGPSYAPDQIAYYIGTYTQNELDRHVQTHRSEMSLRNRMEHVLFDRTYGDLGALKHLELMFNNIRSQLYYDHIKKPLLKEISEENDKFFLDTERAARLSPKPKLVFNTEECSIKQEMIIPSVKTPIPKQGNLGLPIPDTGFSFAKEIGIVGHPILRAALSYPSLVKYMELVHPRTDRVNLASKKSRIYEELKDRLAYRFLTDMSGEL